jgi:hypothetical protein
MQGAGQGRSVHQRREARENFADNKNAVHGLLQVRHGGRKLLQMRQEQAIKHATLWRKQPGLTALLLRREQSAKHIEQQEKLPGLKI